MSSAKFIRKLGDWKRSDARLYKLSEPITDDGTVSDVLELPGSFRGAKDHFAALAGAGYDLEPISGR